MYRHTADQSIIRISDGATIPADPANRDYAAYLEWQAAGNVAAPFAPLPESLIEHCKALCARKLAAGFPYDFGDERGGHAIGTTEADLKGWDEVEKIFAVAVRMGDTGKTVTIATDTGMAVVALADWNAIMLAAEAFRQPIWAASFTIQAKIAQGQITQLAGVDDAADWP